MRTTLMQKYDKDLKEHLLVSTPVDPEFELLMVACTVNLLDGLRTSRFKSTREDDMALLKQSDLPIRKRFAVQHRLDCKNILHSNITLCQILARILARL